MKSCKVALVNPPFNGSFDGIPMGLLYLAAALREHGHQPFFYDFGGTGATSSEAAAKVLGESPDVVAVTSTSPSLKEALDLGREIRSQNKRVVLVKGGWHERFGGGELELKYRPDRVFNCAVTNPEGGEAELVAIADAVTRGEQIPSAAHIRTLNFDLQNAPALKKYQIAHLVPARDLLPPIKNNRYSYHGIFGEIPATQLMTYRGCPFKCTFCAIPSEVQIHGDSAIERDVKAIRDAGYGAVFLDDGTFTLNEPRARKICELLKKHDLVWACQTRIDQVTPDLLTFMMRSGCKYIYFGLETGAPVVSRAIHKILDRTRVIDVIQKTTSLRMRTVTSFIFGVPLPDVEGKWPMRFRGHDGLAEWQQSVELIRAARPDQVVPSIFAYYPGSPAWRHLLPEDQVRYRTGADRESIWEWFDDGYGAIHHVSTEVADDIREFLKRSIPELLWSSEDRTTPVTHMQRERSVFDGPPIAEPYHG